MDKLLVTIFGIAASVFTYWFFFGKKDKVLAVSGSVDIKVEGGYTPNVISVAKGKVATLNFMRKDENSCLEEVVIPDFDIRKELPLDKKISIEIIPQKSGTYLYSCGMGMYHGKIIVR